MTTLITGGAGFIGGNLARRMVAAGEDVVVLDDYSTGRRANVEALGMRLVEGSITDADVVERAIAGCDAVVHLAARGSVPRSLENPRATHNVNATGTLEVLEAARRHGCYVIFSSSSSVFGQNPELPKTETSWTRPLSPYGASKLCAEGYVAAYRTSFGLETQVLRFFNVFGPGQLPDHDYAAVIPKWIHRIQHGEPIEVHGDGTQTRDFTYVDSVTSVIMEAVSRRVSLPGPINLALGQRRSLLGVLEVIERVLGRHAKVEFAVRRTGDVRDSENDPRLLFSTFPDMDLPSFDESISATAEWLAREFGPRPNEGL